MSTLHTYFRSQRVPNYSFKNFCFALMRKNLCTNVLAIEWLFWTLIVTIQQAVEAKQTGPRRNRFVRQSNDRHRTAPDRPVIASLETWLGLMHVHSVFWTTDKMKMWNEHLRIFSLYPHTLQHGSPCCGTRLFEPNCFLFENHFQENAKGKVSLKWNMDTWFLTGQF